MPARIGCLPAEQEKDQDVAFDVIVYFDAIASCKSDRLEDTIDYMSIKNILIDTCKSNRFFLLEKLAWMALDRIFAAFPQAEEIHFKIKKFASMPDAEHVGFGIVARRP